MIKVVITGNIATGKTTLGSKIAERLGLLFQGIDEQRREAFVQIHWDENKFTDRRHFHNYRNAVARSKLYQLMEDRDEGVYEASGFAKGFVESLESIGMPTIHFHLTCPIEEVIRRTKARYKSGHRHPPVPEWWSEGKSPLEALIESARFMSRQPFPKANRDDYEFYTMNSASMGPKKTSHGSHETHQRVRRKASGLRCGLRIRRQFLSHR